MKLMYILRVVVVAFGLFLTACGNSGGGTSSPPPPATYYPRFGFAVNRTDSTVSTYLINATTGQWRHYGYASTGTTPVAVAVSFNENFVFTANDSGTVSSYKLNTTNGRLEFAGNTPTSGANPSALVVAPNIPMFLYVANAGGDNIAGFSVDGNGVLSPTVPATTSLGVGAAPSALILHPTQAWLYVANSGSGAIWRYKVNITDGSLFDGAGPYAVGTNPQDLVIDPSGQFLYVANEGSDKITAFKINSTDGTLNTPTLVDAGDGPRSITVAAAGKYAYAANYNNGTISIFTVDAADGHLTAAGTMSNPIAAPRSLRADPSGNFLFVASETGNSVLRYQINTTNGALTALNPSRTRAQPYAMAVSKGATPMSIRAQFGYAVSSPNSITPYTVSNGVLTAGTALNTGLSPTSVAADLYGRFAYVANNSDSNLSGYTINSSSGTLTSATGSPFAITNAQPVYIVVDPSGRYAFVSDTDPVNGDDVHAFTINAANGVLSANGSIAAGTDPSGITIDPTGQFLYVANQGTTTVSGYRINVADGTLTALAGSPYSVGVGPTPAPTSVAVDPSGRYLYVTYSGEDRIGSFTINASSGALAVVGSAAVTGTQPVSVSVEPAGKYVYVANAGGNISVFNIGSDGSLSTNSTATNINAPAWLTVDPSGSYLYLVDGVAIARYDINSNGSLSSPVNTGLSGSTAFTLTGRLQ
jgi:6-phosphogluconolactonase